MYEDRYIAFIDLLGFGNLVEESVIDSTLPEKILAALLSIQPEKIDEEAYASINYEVIPENEIEEVKVVLAAFSKAAKTLHPVKLTYFSDSLVLSADSNDPIASQMILDILAKLNINLWVNHSLTLRGGITKGKLIHLENGPLFGPAMNRAYKLESKLAINPRILIDDECLESFRHIDSFSLFESLIENDGQYNYISLGTSFRHIINDSSLTISGEAVISKYRTWLSEAPEKLLHIKNNFDDSNIKNKYEWLLTEVINRKNEIRQP